MHWNTYGPSLICYGSRNCLPYPPRGICAELITPLIFKLIHGLHESDVTFLNQVQELEPPIGILLRNADHKPQVGLYKLAFGLLCLVYTLFNLF